MLDLLDDAGAELTLEELCSPDATVVRIRVVRIDVVVGDFFELLRRP